MKIIQLNENKFKIHLHIDELNRYNLDVNTFMSFKIQKNPIILDLLYFIDKTNLIPINNKSLNLEMFLVNNTDILIFINTIRMFL